MITYLPSDRLIIGYGLDPGLRHGALVRSLFHFSDERKLITLRQVDVCYRWDKLSAMSLTQNSPYEKYQSLGSQVASSLTNDHGVPVAFDWDRSAVYWSKTGVQLVQLAYLVGYMTRAFHTAGHPVIMMQPSEIRKLFGLSAREKKEKVWEAFQQTVKVEHSLNLQLSDAYSDLRDSVILGYCVAQAQKKLDKNAEQPFTASLPG
jgi:hypothetical protein